MFAALGSSALAYLNSGYLFQFEGGGASSPVGLRAKVVETRSKTATGVRVGVILKSLFAAPVRMSAPSPHGIKAEYGSDEGKHRVLRARALVRAARWQWTPLVAHDSYGSSYASGDGVS